MTAALENLTGPAVRARSRARGARVLTVLAIVLPVPLLAALGLSLPLPATVERLAAKLVPFGDSGALDRNASRALARGSIVLAPGEQRVGRIGATPSSGSPVSPLRARTADHGAARTTSSPATAITAPGGRASDNATHRGSTPSVPGSSGAVSNPAAPPSGGPPAPDPQPAPPPPPPAPAPVIATVTTAASTATATAKATVDGAATAATGVLGGIKPP